MSENESVKNEEHNAPEVDQVDVQAEAESTAAAEVTPVDQLIAENEALKDEVATLKDQMLRVQADAQNVRRRAEKDVESAHKFGSEKIIKDFLNVADNLERAISSIDSDDEANKAISEGVELTLKSLVDALERHKAVAIHPVGEPFDPKLHQAMAMVPNPDLEPNTVMDVMQKGYSLHGRVIRPAMVVVSK